VVKRLGYHPLVRRRLLAVLLVCAAGCAHFVHQETRVAVRARAAPTDQAVAIFHSSAVCSFTIRDPSGQLQDMEERRGGLLPIDMARAVPDRPWWIENSGYPSLMVTVIAMPPGRYELVGYAEAKGWQEDTDENGRALGRTNCPHRWRLDDHQVQLPFEVRSGEVALLRLPAAGWPGWHWKSTRSSLDSVYAPDVRANLQSWKAAIIRAQDEAYAAFLSSIKQTREGYDLYPRCAGPSMTAVVRAEGTPFPWYGNYKKEVIEPFRRRVPVGGIPDSTGFGVSCVDKRGAFHINLIREDDLERSTRSVGDWLARENLQGEVDITVTGQMVDLAAPTKKN